MTNEQTARAINEEITIDLLDDPELIELLIEELQSVKDRKLGKK